jgi:sugar phosphate isomerase/epimerase
MRLGVMTSLWAYAKKLSVMESLERISSLGIYHVDILGILHGHPLQFSTREKEQIRDQLSSHQLALGSLILLPLENIASKDKEENLACWHYVQAGIDLMAYWGGKQVLFNGGKRAFGVDHIRSWQNAVRFIREASTYAQEKDVYVTVEAESYIYYLENDLETTRLIVEDVDHPHCVTLVDLGHMNLSLDAPETLEAIKPWTMRIHLSENDGLLHANDQLGTGMVPKGSYLEYLHQHSFDQVCSRRKIELIAVMELGVLGQDISDADAYARDSMEYALKSASFMSV